MKRISWIVLIGSIVGSIPGAGTAWGQARLPLEAHWYHGEIKRPLAADLSRVFVGLPDDASDAAVARALARLRLPILPYNPKDRKVSPNAVVLYTRNVSTAAQYLRVVQALKNEPFFTFASPCFLGPRGEWKTYADEIVVKTALAEPELRELVQSAGAKIVKADPYMPGVWLLKLSDPKGEKTSVTVANALYETGRFAYAEPNFMRQIKPMTNDPYFNQQWALKNTGAASVPQGGSVAGADIEIEPAWAITTGSPNIRVAIIDQGVDFNHPDLPNVLPGFDPGGHSVQGEPVDPFEDSHGTPCAGIVAAQINNNTDVAGVAPLCKIVPVYLIGVYSMTDDYEVSTAFNWCRTEGQADVLSNSWRVYDFIGTAAYDAVTLCATVGRNGLGCVILGGSGNEDIDDIGFPANHPNVMAVGGSSPCDERKSYDSCDGEAWGACYGSNLDLVAPCVYIYSLDIVDDAGYDSGNVTTFGGTSSACPIAAGVAALALSLDPGLTRQQVERALIRGCEKVGNYAYGNNPAHPVSTWNNQMGHGRLNAKNTLDVVMGGVPFCDGTTTLNTTNGTVSDGSGPNDYLPGTDCCWLIQPFGATQITLNFTQFQTELGHDVVRVYSGSTTNNLVGEYSGSNLPSALVVNNASALICFVSDDDDNVGQGFSLNYTSNGVPDYCSGHVNYTAASASFCDGSPVLNYGNSAYCTFRIQPPVGTTAIRINFSEFDVIPGWWGEGGDYLLIYRGINSSGELIGQFDNNNAPDEVVVIGSAAYLVFVSDEWESGAGWCLSYQALTDPVYCLGTQTFTAISGTLTDGSGPNNYYDNAGCCWRIRPANVQEGVLELNFTQFGLAGEDTLYVYDGPNDNAPLLGAFTGSDLPGTFFASNRVLYLCLNSNPGETGPGFSADWTIRYCVAQQNLSGPSGFLSDGSGGETYAPGADCCWLIDAGDGDGQLIFKFDSFATEPGDDYIVVYDGETTSAPVLGTFSGYSEWPAPSLNPTSNRFLVCFRADGDGVVDDGFRARWFRQFCSGTTTLTDAQGSFCDGSGPNDFPPGTSCSWIIGVEDATYITLNFTEFDLGAGWLGGGEILVYNQAGEVVYFFNTWQPPTGPVSILGNYVRIEFNVSEWSEGGAGWCLDYVSSTDPVFCLGTQTLNEPSGVVTDGSGPENYYNNSNCCWRIAPWAWEGQLQLTFTEFDLAPGDVVTIWDGNPDWGAPIIGTYTGNQLPPVINASGLELYLCFTSNASGTAGGFSANYNLNIPMYCSPTTTLLAPSGEVCDGSGPASYYNNTNCSWLISPSEATQITIRFTEFLTEFGWDYVRIYRGSQALPLNLLHEYHGYLQTPFEVTLPYGQILVVFTSDGSVTDQGWCFTYTSDGIAPTCTGEQTLTGATGAFCDGSGPQNYTNNLDCGWKITPLGNPVSIRLWFEDFDLAPIDKVLIYASDAPTGSPIAGFTSDNLPVELTIENPAAYVQFLTNASNTAAGWCARYEAFFVVPGCIGSAEPLTAPTGTFSDGSDEADYANNLFCTWTLRPSAPHTNIVLTFNALDTESDKDWVRVYDGPNQQSALLGSFSGTPETPFEIVGTAQEMLVVFTTDAAGVSAGWNAEYRILNEPSRCSGTQTLTAPTGAFSDGSGAENYGVNSECYWLIQPPGVAQVVLAFDEFALESGADFVRIYGGVSTQSPLLATHTGAGLPPERTYNVPVLVGFRTDGKNNLAGFSANYASVVSRENVLNPAFGVYPNPNNGTFVIQASRPANVTITDAKGAAVRTFKVEKSAEVSLDKAGIYAVTLQSGTAVETTKITVVK